MNGRQTNLDWRTVKQLVKGRTGKAGSTTSQMEFEEWQPNELSEPCCAVRNPDYRLGTSYKNKKNGGLTKSTGCNSWEEHFQVK